MFCSNMLLAVLYINMLVLYSSVYFKTVALPVCL